MIEAKTTPAIMKAIKAFEDSVSGHTMKGSTHPSLWDEIEEDYATKRTRLIATINRALHKAYLEKPTCL